MASITTRGSKGTPLTHNEVDANFSNLNSDKLDTAGIALGSAASPTIKFTGDTNTGIYSPGADQVAVSAGGTGRLFVTGGGVGIGASPVGFRLDVQGGGQRILNQGATSFIEIGQGTTTNQNAYIDLITDTTYTDYGLRLIRDNGGANGNASLVNRGTGELRLISEQAGAIAFLTNNTERGRIDSSGRLLMGTSNAGLTQTGALSPFFQVNGSNSNFSSSAIGVWANSASSNPSINLLRNKATSSGGFDYTGGTVALNDILGAIDFYGVDDGATPVMRKGAAIQAVCDSTPTTTEMPSRLVFFTTADGAAAPTERMRITSAGNVGIGTSSPGSALTVNGTCRVQNASSFAGINVRNDNDSSVVTTTSFYDASNNLGTIDGHLFFEHLTTGGSNAVIATTPAGDRSSDRRVTRLIISAAGTTTLNSASATAPFITQINGSEVARIDSSGRLLIGTSTSRSSRLGLGAFSPFFQIESDTEAAQSITRWSADVAGSRFHLQKGRGTIASPSAVTQGDTLGEISFSGYDSANMTNGARIQAAVDGAPGANDMPGRLVFLTTAETSGSPTERMRITQQGVIAYNQAAPATCNTSATITAADLTNRIITSSTAAAVTMTLPTGTDIEAAFSGLYNNFTFEFGVINTGPNTLTVGANGNTLVGSMTVATGTSARFAARRTAASTWTVYRLV